MNRSHSRHTFPAGKPIPKGETAKGGTQLQRKIQKKFHTRKSRRFLKGQALMEWTTGLGKV